MWVFNYVDPSLFVSLCWSTILWNKEKDKLQESQMYTRAVGTSRYHVCIYFYIEDMAKYVFFMPQSDNINPDKLNY